MKKYLILLFITCSLFANSAKNSENKSQYIHKKVGNFIYLIKIPDGFTYKIQKSKTNSQDILEIRSKSKNSVATIFENYIYNDVVNISNGDLNEIIKNNKMLSLDDFVEDKFIFKHFKKLSSSYIELTDKSLVGKKDKIGDYKHFTTGLISLRNLVIPFIALTNDKKSKEYTSIINMFENSFFVSQDVYIKYFRD